MKRTGFRLFILVLGLISFVCAGIAAAPPVLANLTVTYNGNSNTGGSVPVDAKKYAQGQSVKVLGNTKALVRTGYKFDGWNTAADLSGKNAAADSTFTMPNTNVKLFAKWVSEKVAISKGAPVFYVVTFDSQGATTPANPAKKTASTLTRAGRTVDSLPTAPTKAGNIFAGWFLSINGLKAFTASMAVTENITVFAKWTPAYKYVVTFDGQGATNPPPKNVVSPATTVGALPTAPIRTGYEFGGWFAQANGQGTAFTASTAVTTNTTVFAKWKIYSYIVTFDSQGATTPASPASKEVVTPQTTVRSLPRAPIRTGYEFEGWFTSANGGGSAFTASTAVAGNTTIFAKWTHIYVIGDVGPAGGLVFYDKGNYSDGWRYLEAAPSDQSTSIKWNNGSNILTGASGTYFGTGQSNTTAIVSKQGAGNYAAKICADLVLGGKDDWFLPSRSELDGMYARLKVAGLGGFASEDYWSSSQNNGYYAWKQHFASGYRADTYSDTQLCRVRAVRAF